MKAILLMLGALSAAIIFVGCGTAVGRATGVDEKAPISDYKAASAMTLTSADIQNIVDTAIAGEQEKENQKWENEMVVESCMYETQDYVYGLFADNVPVEDIAAEIEANFEQNIRNCVEDEGLKYDKEIAQLVADMEEEVQEELRAEQEERRQEEVARNINSNNRDVVRCQLARLYGVPVGVISLDMDGGDSGGPRDNSDAPAGNAPSDTNPPSDENSDRTPLDCDELLGLTSESAEAVEEAQREAEEERRQEEERRLQEEEERVARQVQEAIEEAAQEAAEEADRNNLLRQECWTISENRDESLQGLVRLFEDCISEHPDAEELTAEFWAYGSQSGWGSHQEESGFGGQMMQNSYDGQQGQDDGGDGWVANEGDGGWGGTVCQGRVDGWDDNEVDGWVDNFGDQCDMSLQEGVDELRDRVSELEELIQELTEALQPN